MPLSLLNHSALALFAQRTRIPTSARSTGFCTIWVCISSSSSSAAFGALRNIFADKYLSEELKSEVYTALILSAVLFGCEARSLRLRAFKVPITGVLVACENHVLCELPF